MHLLSKVRARTMYKRWATVSSWMSRLSINTHIVMLRSSFESSVKWWLASTLSAGYCFVNNKYNRLQITKLKTISTCRLSDNRKETEVQNGDTIIHRNTKKKQNKLIDRISINPMPFNCVVRRKERSRELITTVSPP